jgi:hypothetical protein
LGASFSYPLTSTRRVPSVEGPHRAVEANKRLPTRHSAEPHGDRKRRVPPTSAPGLGLIFAHICVGTGVHPRPHLRRDWGSPPPTSAPGLGSPLPHLRRDWPKCRYTDHTGDWRTHICPGTQPHLLRAAQQRQPTHRTRGCARSCTLARTDCVSRRLCSCVLCASASECGMCGLPP